MDSLTDGNLKNAPGEAWVKNGKVFVKNPIGEGKPAIIIPHELTRVAVNGEMLSGSRYVNQYDEITVETVNHEIPGKVTFEIYPDGLSASINIQLTTVKCPALTDQDPGSILTLSVATETIKRFPIDEPLFMQELKDNNIIHGINFEALKDLLTNPRNGIFTIAKGDAPGQAVDDHIELIYMENQETETNAQKINLLEINQIVSVKKGDILAVRHRGKKGIPGKKVTGEIIIPPEPLALALTAGDGTELSDDGNRLFALRDGRPVLKKSGQNYHISVEHFIQINEDVGISTGNVRFNGDVNISENVLEGMTVQASENITVNKMVFNARIGAQGNITIGQSAIGSTIVAGADSAFYKKISQMLEDLYSGLSEIAKTIPVIINNAKFSGVGAGQVAQILIDKKYTGFPGLMTELKSILKENEFVMNKQTSTLINRVCDNLTGINILKVKEISDLNQLSETIWEVKDYLNTLMQSTANIAVGGQVTSCEIEASGNVSIAGTGCINTTIRAGKSVNVSGVFRGGRITAKRDVVLGEAGSGTGVRTVIETSEKGKIFIKKSYEGVDLRVGRCRTNVASTLTNIKVGLDSNGNLVFLN